VSATISDRRRNAFPSLVSGTLHDRSGGQQSFADVTASGKDAPKD
jgi:hypothetical protein